MVHKDEDILDSDFRMPERHSLIVIVHWWHQKRRFYNIVVILTQTTAMVTFWDQTLSFGIFKAFIGSLLHLIAANLLYGMGIGLDITLHQYNQKLTFSKVTRTLVFVAGLAFSVRLTWIMYVDALKYFYLS